MAKGKEFRGVCIIKCASGNKTFQNITRKECMEKTSAFDCTPSWESCDESSVCQI